MQERKTSGKTIESLQVSREIRSDFIQRYGQIPTSILKNDRYGNKQTLDPLRDCGQRNYASTGTSNLTGKKVLKEFEISGKGPRGRRSKGERSYSSQYIDCPDKEDVLLTKAYKESFYFGNRGVRQGSLSTFPQNIGMLVVEFYCPVGGTIYDPFAGHNSRMQLTYNCQRNYIGVDVSKEFMKHNFEVKELLENQKGFFKSKSIITLIEGSSANVPQIKNNSADFTLTSPPYWDVEYYGDELEQLGNAKTYDKFLELLFIHVQENFRILKPGSYCCWFINDFIKDGIFYPYHCDLYYLFIDAGFTQDNIYIVDLGQPLTAAFVQQIEKLKRFPKRHEFCLVFRKTEGK